MNNLLLILSNIEFGMNEALGIIILLISCGLLVSELRSKKSGDLLTNVIISLLLLGVSIYNLATVGFTSSSILITVCYIIIILIAIVYTVLFVLHYMKYKNVKDEEKTDEPEQQIEEINEEDIKEE